MKSGSGKASAKGSEVPGRFYFYVLLGALVFRLILFAVGNWEDDIIDSYDSIAINLLEGRGFSYNDTEPTVCRAPAYPVYLSVIFLLFGYSPQPLGILRIVDVIFDSIIAVAVLWLSSLWFPKLNRYSKLGAGLIYAFNPFIAYYTLKLGAETLSILFLTVYVGLLYKVFFQKKFGYIGIIFLGIIGGILILNKSIFLPLLFLIPFLLFALFSKLRNKRFVGKASLAFVVSCLILLPWSWRCTHVADRLVLVQTLTGFNFWYDFTLDENRNTYFAAGKLNDSIIEEGAVRLSDGRAYYPYSLGAKEDAIYDSELNRKAIRWIEDNPLKFILKMFDNFLSFWYLVKTPKKMIIAAFFSLTFILVSLKGALLNFSSGYKSESIFLLVLIAIIALIYAPVLSMFRYSLVTYPLLSMLAGSALSYVTFKIFPRKLEEPQGLQKVKPK